MLAAAAVVLMAVAAGPGRAAAAPIDADPATVEVQSDLTYATPDGTAVQLDVDKRYVAVVRGWAPTEAEIDHPLREEPERAPQPAHTSLRRLATVELPIPVGRYPQARYSLVELVPHTGRLHQLRKHLAHLRHPIVGDVRHGEGRHNRLFREHLGIRRLLLHAWWLALPHPHHDRPLRIRAPLDDELRGLLQRLGWAEAGLTCDRSPPGSLPSASSAT